MTRLIPAAALLLVVLACQHKPKEVEAPAADSAAISPFVSLENQLTEQQKAQGLIALFDGKTLDGWHIYKNKENDSWEVADGTLHCKPFVENGTNKRSDLTTNEQYENFELYFDWKISPQGNSGVMFHVVETYDEPYGSGPEYQVLDDVGYPGDLKDVQLTAANYDMHVAGSNKKMNPVGEWNNSKLVVNHNHVEHWLNGEKVVEYDLGSDDWNQRLAKSKWKDFPGYAKSPKGHIDLQDHGNEVWYKNIYLKPL